MANRSDLMGVGFAAQQALMISTQPESYTATPGITVQASATSLGGANPKIALLTVASGTGTTFTLPASPPSGLFVYTTNLLASLATATIYPATGNLLNGATNGTLLLTTGQSAVFYTVAAGTALSVSWYSIKSA